MSLLTMSAVALALLISRQIQERDVPEERAPAGEPVHTSYSLDEIRAAGF